MAEHASWGLEEGEEIAPGRVALKPLGGGNRYEVFLVWDDELFALAVAKLLRPDQADDEKALRDLDHEVDALRAMAHPALVRCFDADLEGPRPHVLIEHLAGPSLRRLIRRDGAIPLEQLLPLVAQVAGALQYMAQAGYVHLDVKPDNIVMGVPPRVIDLSIARPLARRPGGEAVPARRWRGRGGAVPAAGRRPGRAPLAPPGGAPRPGLRAARPRPGTQAGMRRDSRAPRAADRGDAAADEAHPPRLRGRLTPRCDLRPELVLSRYPGGYLPALGNAQRRNQHEQQQRQEAVRTVRGARLLAASCRRRAAPGRGLGRAEVRSALPGPDGPHGSAPVPRGQRRWPDRGRTRGRRP